MAARQSNDPSARTKYIAPNRPNPDHVLQRGSSSTTTTENAVIGARIHEATTSEAGTVFATMGLSLPDPLTTISVDPNDPVAAQQSRGRSPW